MIQQLVKEAYMSIRTWRVKENVVFLHTVEVCIDNHSWFQTKTGKMAQPHAHHSTLLQAWAGLGQGPVFSFLTSSQHFILFIWTVHLPKCCSLYQCSNINLIARIFLFIKLICVLLLFLCLCISVSVCLCLSVSLLLSLCVSLYWVLTSLASVFYSGVPDMWLFPLPPACPIQLLLSWSSVR